MRHYLNPLIYYNRLMSFGIRSVEKKDSGIKGVTENCSTCVFQILEGDRACNFKYCPAEINKISTKLKG